MLMAMGILVEYPILGAAVGILLLGLGRLKHQRTAMAVGVIWLLYAVYETGMQRRWLCSGECNIRIDLLAIYPALLISLVVAGVSLLRRQREPRPPA
jgi:Na+/proline symporter